MYYAGETEGRHFDASSVPWIRLWAILWSGILLLSVAGCASEQTRTDGDKHPTVLLEVRRISFTGNDRFSAFNLRRAMETQGRPLLQPWKRGGLFDQAILEADILRLRKFYFDRGFLYTSIKLSEIKENPESNSVSLVVEIDEGPETLIEVVRIAGTLPPELATEEDLLAKLALRPGARLSKEAFDLSEAQLLAQLQDIGYARADVIPDTQVNAKTHQASVTFRLEPSSRATFGSVSIMGAEQVADFVIQREIRLREGDTYSRTALTESRENILELGMFRGVTARALNIEETDEPVDIRFTVQERKPQSIEFGIGISSVESVRFAAKWLHRNVFEESQSLTMLGRVTGISQSLELDLRDPYFFDSDTMADYRLFALNHKRLNTDPFEIFDIVDPFPAYDLLTHGAEWRLQHDFRERLAGIAGLEFTSNDFYNVELSPEQVILEGAEDNKLFVQFAEAQWNDRDNDLITTRGVLLRAKLDHSNTALISDESFVKLELEGRYYRPLLGQSVFATRLRIGGIEPYAESVSVPSNVRFFAGGPGSVRGYQMNRLGPLDSNENPLGGNSLIEGSVEIRYPIAGQIGGTAFVDFGNVFVPSFHYPLDKLKYSVGAGLTYMTPVGPLRAELAYVINPEDRDLTSPFFFAIGQAF